MTRQRTSAALLASLVALILLAPAAADEQRLADGNDTRGPLDIAWIKHGHVTADSGTRRLIHTIRLFERWPVRQLRHRGFINLFFDLRGNRDWRPERAVYITFRNGKLHAEMFDFAAEPPSYMRDVAMWRPNARTVKVAFPKRALRRAAFDYYEWESTSYIEQGHDLCGERGGCDDHASSLRHDL